MKEIFLLGLITISIVILIEIVYNSQKKYKWFKNLKPGDEIIVTIFSENCECERPSIVKEQLGNNVKAEMLTDTITNCENCAKINSKNEKNEPTCWYKVTVFNKKDVYKIENKSHINELQ